MSDDAERAIITKALHRVDFLTAPRLQLISKLLLPALREARAEEQLEVVHYLRNQGWPALAERIQNGAHKDYPRQSRGD